MNQREALKDIARSHGIPDQVLTAAFDHGSSEAINQLLSRIQSVPNAPYLIPRFTEDLLKSNFNDEQFLHMAEVLLQRPNHSVPALTQRLAPIPQQRALDLPRRDR